MKSELLNLTSCKLEIFSRISTGPDLDLHVNWSALDAPKYLWLIVENLSNVEESIYNLISEIHTDKKIIFMNPAFLWCLYNTHTKIHRVCKQHQAAINGISLGLKEKKKAMENYAYYLFHTFIPLILVGIISTLHYFIYSIL